MQAISFDYAGFGESSGARRQHLNPWQQISDYRNAVTYAESRDDVDALRLGCLGISYIGGHVLILAAIDPPIKSIISILPAVDGYKLCAVRMGIAASRICRQPSSQIEHNV